MLSPRTTQAPPHRIHHMTTTRQPDSQPEPTSHRPETIDSTHAAQLLGITEDAIRKRITRGTLKGYKEDGRWYVHLPDNDQNYRTADQNHITETTLAIEELRARVQSLETQLEVKDTQIGELHRLMATTALNPAPARPWWRIW